jgi:hypothetical protein
LPISIINFASSIGLMIRFAERCAIASEDHVISATASINFSLIILGICAFPDTGDRLGVGRAPEVFAFLY